MGFFYFLSESIIPLMVFLIVCYGLLNRQNIYQDFLEGAKDGFHTVIDILPTLIGLMTAVGILRASGFLDFLSKLLGKFAAFIHFPAELVPISIMMSCTETIFYTMSIYFLHVGIKKTRFTLFGALFSTICGIAASVFIAGLLTT